MQIQQLTYVVALAEAGSFTAAAAQVGVAQPTLSKQVRVLETELGTPLFDRTRAGVVLTQAGETLLPYARRIVTDAGTARRQVRELAGLRRGRMRLGATPSLCTGLLAGALSSFRADHPGVELHVHESGSRDLERLLMDGDLDLALVIGGPGRHDPALSVSPLLREDLVVVSAADRPSPLGDVETVRVADLQGVPLVMFRAGYELREVTTAACTEAGFRPTLAIEGGEMDSVLRFVEAGLGVAVVPSMVVAGRPGLRPTALGSPRLRRTVSLAHRRGIAPPPSATAFRRVLAERLRSLPPALVGSGIEVLQVRVGLDLLDLRRRPEQ